MNKSTVIIAPKPSVADDNIRNHSGNTFNGNNNIISNGRNSTININGVSFNINDKRK